MSNLQTYVQPQTECLWLKAEGTICASGGTGFENFTENPDIPW